MLQRIPLFVTLVTTGFVAAFFIEEAAGLQSLADFLINAITTFPDYVGRVSDYFGQVPSDHLQSSLLVGAISGGILTALFMLLNRGWLTLPNISGRTVTLGVGTSLVYYALGGRLDGAVGLGLLVFVVAALIFDDSVRHFPRTLGSVANRNALAAAGSGFLMGGALGGISSQILLFSSDHCTYASSGAEYRFGLVLTALSSVILLLPLWALLGGSRSRSKGVFGNGFGLPYLFLAPTLLLLTVFLYFPATQLISLSFQLTVRGRDATRPVCMSNYIGDESPLIGLVNNTTYAQSFNVTILITIAVVLFSLAIALGVALLASQKVKGAAIYRTFLIWPYAVSPVVTGVIFLTLFRQGGAGLINYYLETFFGMEPNWITDADLAPWVIIAASVWNAIGFNILFYIAGLQNIPVDLLEAASLDGANRVQRFFRVTFPLLSPFTFFLLVTNVTYSFYGIYGVVDTLTQGGPPLGSAGELGGATEVLIYRLYNDTFDTGALIGSAAAQSIVLFLMVAVLTFIQFRYLERRVTYGS